MTIVSNFVPEYVLPETLYGVANAEIPVRCRNGADADMKVLPKLQNIHNGPLSYYKGYLKRKALLPLIVTKNACLAKIDNSLTNVNRIGIESNNNSRL